MDSLFFCMKSYLKTLIFFPLILQIIVTALLVWLDDNSDGSSIPFSHYVLTAFFLTTIPAFLTALLAAKFRYARYHIASIVLISSIIAFVYCNMASYLYLMIQGEQNSSFWHWVTGGGLSLGLISTCGMVFYALFVMPWLLPKERSNF